MRRRSMNRAIRRRRLTAASEVPQLDSGRQRRSAAQLAVTWDCSMQTNRPNYRPGSRAMSGIDHGRMVVYWRDIRGPRRPKESNKMSQVLHTGNPQVRDTDDPIYGSSR